MSLEAAQPYLFARRSAARGGEDSARTHCAGWGSLRVMTRVVVRVGPAQGWPTGGRGARPGARFFSRVVRMSLASAPAAARPRWRAGSSSRTAPRCRACRLAAAASASSPPSTVLALDFDGVICDSVGESAESGLRVRSPSLAQRVLPGRCREPHLPARQAAERQWPALFAEPGARAARARVLADMRLVRPVVETGYENVVQARLLLEGTPPAAILESWRRAALRCWAAKN